MKKRHAPKSQKRMDEIRSFTISVQPGCDPMLLEKRKGRLIAAAKVDVKHESPTKVLYECPHFDQLKSTSHCF